MSIRFVIAFLTAIGVTFIVMWVGAWLAGTISGHVEHNDFTVGEKMMLCNRVVDTRHELSGYDYDVWKGNRCNNLSDLEECMLDCLARAGTLRMGESCYPDCVKK